MTELEQRLTNELSKLAAQYEQDQKRLFGQVEHLEGQVRELAAQQRRRSGGVYQVEQDLRGAGDTLGGASAEIGRSARVRSAGVRQVERAHVGAAGKLERTCREIDQGIQRTSAAFGRGLKAVRDAVEQEWNPWDRVEGRIESLIARSRDRGGPER